MNADQATYVLDSFALLAYFSGEPGMARVQEVMNGALDGKNQLLLSMINLGEVVYITERELGLSKAQAALAAVEQLPVKLLPVSKEAVLAAAHIKANYPIAYADAFAVAAALEFEGTLITGDPEFKRVEDLVCLDWLTK